MKILVTGVTGYIGGRLVTRLLEKGYNVVCMARDLSRIENRFKGAEKVQGDVLNRDSLRTALEGVEIAYYLIHSMSAGEKDFAEKDLTAAKNFSEVAELAGVKKIIYLGGLSGGKEELSEHLNSRLKTGDALRSTKVIVVEFRAGMIVGSGSLSFEMVRYLTERVPVMILPKWVRTETQPIAIRDVLNYLVKAIELNINENKIFDIGGADILTYKDLMKIYADIRGLKRLMLDIPFLTPRLSSYWVDFVTPVPANIARPLIEGLKYKLVCGNNNASEVFGFSPISYRQAVELALKREKEGKIETIWSGSLSSINAEKPVTLNLIQKEGMIIEEREIEVKASPKILFNEICKIGGKNGWYGNFLWQLRGILDRIFGGIGMRRGRRDPINLLPGDPLDFWRVEEVYENELLRLRAEMKVPGRAWLQFKIIEKDKNISVLTQTAFFEPKGLSGLLYWYSIYFLHGFIFGGMIKDFKKKAERINIIE